VTPRGRFDHPYKTVEGHHDRFEAMPQREREDLQAALGIVSGLRGGLTAGD
jgi:hypothetical protein